MLDDATHYHLLTLLTEHPESMQRKLGAMDTEVPDSAKRSA